MEPQYLLFQFSYIHEVIIHADDYLFLKDSVTGSKTGLVNTNRVDNDTISAFNIPYTNIRRKRSSLSFY